MKRVPLPFRRWRGVALLFAVVVLLGFAFRGSLLVASAAFLDVTEEPTAADAIYILGGDINIRPAGAAGLYHRRLAPRLLLARVTDSEANLAGLVLNETDAARELLVRLGVPDSSIVFLRPEGGVGTTTDEAVVLRHFLERRPLERVIVVTSGFHTRRARWNLRRQLAGVPVEIQMVGVPDARFSEQNWWRTERGMLIYAQEYLKFAHNWIYRARVQ